VPNGEIRVASNRTRTWARINQNVTVAFGTDIDKAIQVVEELGQSMAADPVWKRRILEPPRVERVESIDERGVTLKILGTVRASEQWAAGGEFRKLLLETFARNGIQLPRPQQVFVAHPDPSVTAATEPVGPGPSQDDLADE
jgi:small-conductance mechanosensitive channel